MKAETPATDTTVLLEFMFRLGRAYLACGEQPATVTFLPSFWLLVPGALGLLSVTRMLSDRAAGLDGMVTVVSVLTSIALGTLVGASLYRWLTETFGAWRLQIGRVGSYFRRKNEH